jgi:hypothetical protein
MTESKAAPTPVPENLSPAARAILEQQGVRLEPPAGSNGSSAAEPSKQIPKEVSIDIDGVTRVVSVDDLADAYRRRSETVSAAKALEQRLASVGQTQALQALQQAIDGLPPRERAQVFSILQGQGDEPEPEVEDGIDGATPEPARRQVRPQSDPRIDRLEQGLQALAAEANERIAARKEETRKEKVQRLMQSVPLFEENKTASGLAEKLILTQLALHPNRSEEDVVQEAAKTLTQLEQRARDGAVAERRVPQPGFNLPEQKRGVLTGKGLRAGDVRRAALRALNGM